MKVKKPKLDDYLKQSKGQGIGQTTGQNVSVVVQVDTTRTV